MSAALMMERIAEASPRFKASRNTFCLSLFLKSICARRIGPMHQASSLWRRVSWFWLSRWALEFLEPPWACGCLVS